MQFFYWIFLLTKNPRAFFESFELLRWPLVCFNYFRPLTWFFQVINDKRLLIRFASLSRFNLSSLILLFRWGKLFTQEENERKYLWDFFSPRSRSLVEELLLLWISSWKQWNSRSSSQLRFVKWNRERERKNEIDWKLSSFINKTVLIW